MASCEKCWQESCGDPDRYKDLLKINGCSPEEQAGGTEAKVCKKCNRKTIHVYVDRCMNPDCST